MRVSIERLAGEGWPLPDQHEQAVDANADGGGERAHEARVGVTQQSGGVLGQHEHGVEVAQVDELGEPRLDARVAQELVQIVL